MGRPPLGGVPAFRFLPKEVAEMERALEESKGANPARETVLYLAEKFSAAPERAGKIVVQWKQIWNWFQNRRHAQRSKGAKMAIKLNPVSSPFDDSLARRAAASSYAALSGIGRRAPGSPQMEFEARSARDKAWYDVATFLTHRMLEADDPEVKVRFAGFGAEDDEWVNVRKSVRRRSLPCEVSECIAVLEGDLILCFQEGKEQALYFDAHVLKVQRRRHDVRGCRCRFIVRYDHDQCEEVVPLRKVCRRPETDYRLQELYASKRSASVALVQGAQQTEDSSTSNDYPVLQEVPKSSSASMEAIVQSAAIPMSCLSLSDNVHVSAEAAPCLPAAPSNLSQNIITLPHSSVIQVSDSRPDDAAMKLGDQ